MSVNMNKLARSFQDLEVYQEAFRLQQQVFELSKAWPDEERYALTDQIRRSSRSIGANLAESWAKRRYPAHFLNKLTDANGELQETFHRLTTASACGYVSVTDQARLTDQAHLIGRQLGTMIANHESFCL